MDNKFDAISDERQLKFNNSGKFLYKYILTS